MAEYTSELKDYQGRTALGVRPDGFVEFGFPMNRAGFTPQGGLYIWVVNKTGAPSVRGSILMPYTDTMSMQLVGAGLPAPAAIVYDAGVADGVHMRVVVSGVAAVLFEDGVAPTHAQWCGTSATVAGRAICQASVPDNSGGGIDLHNREIGHVMESKNAGTNVTALVLLHFN